MVRVGKKVADFTAVGTDGKFKLSEHKGKYVVLFFYPRDNTPGCTQEAIEFSKALKRFSDLNAVVVGTSRDSLKSHERFIDKQQLKINLLSDEEEKLCNTFQVLKEKNMYGKKVIGIERSTFLIDPDGKVVHEWSKVKVPDHVKMVLKQLKELSS